MSTATRAAGRTDSTVETMAPRLWSHRGSPPLMDRPHRHDDLELNFLVSGRMRYLFGGSWVDVGPGEIALFWAGTAHQLVRPGTEDGDGVWLHVPLATALGWGLGTTEVATLLRPAPVLVPAHELPHDVGGLFAAWHREVEQGDPAVALLEVQALVRRLLAGAHARPARPRHTARGPEQVDAVVVMARHVADRFRDVVTADDVAAAAHLSTTHAMTVFRRTVGCSIGSYLVRCRVAEAQRLLITTDRTTAEIAHASGFGSQSQFYAHFTRACGTPPGRYRAAVAH